MKRHKYPTPNRGLTLFEEICDIDNLRLAHKHARKGKGWYKEVKEVDKNPDRYLFKLKWLLENGLYKTSEYTIFDRMEGKKLRHIYKLPYFPDRICHWAIIQVIEPILLKQFTRDTYSAIPEKGIHDCLNKVKNDIHKDREGTKYCLKLDVKKYYPSINHYILKEKYVNLFKDEKLLSLLYEIIDSVPNNEGLPIGNYISQYSGNFYLSGFDHWIKEKLRIKYYYRYMDDIVILSSSKKELHKIFYRVKQYLSCSLALTIKDNWQIFPISDRGVDFVGYRIFPDYTLLRRTTCDSMKAKSNKMFNKESLDYSDRCSIQSYNGWLKHCDSYRLTQKYISPLIEKGGFNEKLRKNRMRHKTRIYYH